MRGPELYNFSLKIIQISFKGNAIVIISATTFKYILDSQFVVINAKINGTKSSFSVPKIIAVKLENFVNPVTGDEPQRKYNYSKDLFGKLPMRQGQK